MEPNGHPNFYTHQGCDRMPACSSKSSNASEALPVSRMELIFGLTQRTRQKKNGPRTRGPNLVHRKWSASLVHCCFWFNLFNFWRCSESLREWGIYPNPSTWLDLGSGVGFGDHTTSAVFGKENPLDIELPLRDSKQPCLLVSCSCGFSTIWLAESYTTRCGIPYAWNIYIYEYIYHI